MTTIEIGGCAGHVLPAREPGARTALLGVSLLAALAPGLCAAQSCDPFWTVPGGEPNSEVRAISEARIKGVSALYAGGVFTSIGGQPTKHLARWDGDTWTQIGPGVAGRVNVLLPARLGQSDRLFVGGDFLQPGSNIASWDGALLSPLGSGVDGEVVSLAVLTDEHGASLIAAGTFTRAGNFPARHVARWDGSEWSPMSVGEGEWATCLVVHDDGSGPALFAGGGFRGPDGLTWALARWSGSAWVPVAPSPACGAIGCPPQRLASFDDGSGPAIYAAGNYLPSIVMRWNGQSWSVPAGGIPTEVMCDKVDCYVVNSVDALAVLDDGAGPALYLAGYFWKFGPFDSWCAAKWDGAWTTLGEAPQVFPRSIGMWDDGDGAAIYVGGFLESVGDRHGTLNIGRYACPPVFPGAVGFEPTSYRADAAGAPLVPARGWRSDGQPDSPPTLYTYDANALGLSPNPAGGDQFCGPRADGPGKATLPRHVVDLSGTDLWDLDFDFAAVGGGPPPNFSELARFVLHVMASPGFRVLIDWDDRNAPDTWSIRIDAYDAQGSRRTFDPGPLFHGLASNAWVRIHTQIDLQSNRLTEVALTDLSTGQRAAIHPASWHLVGGQTPQMPRRTSIRLSTAATGNGGPGNLTGWDNVRIEPGSAACAADCDFSGGLSLFDFLCFQNAFNGGLPAADCTGDDVLDLFDFLCFTNIFNQGC